MEEKYKKYSVTIKCDEFTEGTEIEGESPYWAGVDACSKSHAFRTLKDKWNEGYEVVLKDETIRNDCQFYWKLFVDETEETWVKVNVNVEEVA